MTRRTIRKGVRDEMNRTTRMVVGAALIAALALPAFAGGKKEEPKKDDGT